jgi:hypothetical protein
MKKLKLLFTIVIISLNLSAQKYMTKNGFISFYGHTPMEDIKADNNQVASILDTSKGELVFQVLMKSFHFVRALMEEHFNENYVESEKYPKSVFKGKITNLSDINFSKSGIYNVNIEGEMNIHDVSKPFAAKGTLEVKNDEIVAKSKFNIKPEDFNITIPGVVREKIAKEMEVIVEMNYSPMK